MKLQKKLIKPGDIFAVGEHRLACGDCLDPQLVLKLIQDDKIKLVLTDMPYAVGLVESKAGFSKGQIHKPIANDHFQTNPEYRKFTGDFLKAVKPYLAKKNAAYLFNGDKMLRPFLDGIDDAGFHFAQLLIWLKSQAVIGRLDYLPQHELIAYCWAGTHEFLKSKDKSLLLCPKPAKSELHPSMKPVSLLRTLILNSTRIGDILYDCFAGSGSTGIAAEQTKRKCFMIELEPHYCEVILERFEKTFGTKATLIS